MAIRSIGNVVSVGSQPAGRRESDHDEVVLTEPFLCRMGVDCRRYRCKGTMSLKIEYPSAMTELVEIPRTRKYDEGDVAEGAKHGTAWCLDIASKWKMKIACTNHQLYLHTQSTHTTASSTYLSSAADPADAPRASAATPPPPPAGPPRASRLPCLRPTGCGTWSRPRRAACAGPRSAGR